MRASVIAIGDSGEARLIRELLEAQGHEVRLALAGKPSDVFDGFSFFGMPADVAVLAAHGDEDGVVFAEMAPGVDQLELPHDRITPVIFGDNLRQAPPLVISTACGSGSGDFAAAFFGAGAHDYVAPVDYPDGRDIAVWVAVFFRTLANGGPEMALTRANAAVETNSAFRLMSV